MAKDAVAVELASTGLDRLAVEALSSAANEPSWLRERRLNALARYNEIPAPTERTEGWRRLSLAGIDLSAPQPEPWTYVGRVNEKDAARGVLAIPLAEALRSHESLVREVVERRAAVHPLAKFSSLTDSAWSGGAFVYVPDGVELANPILIEVEAASYPRVVVYVGAGAKASISETHYESGRFTTGVTDILVRDSGHLTYAHAQLCDFQTITFSHQHARVGRDAKLVTLNFGMGGRLAKNDVEVELLGPGAESDMLGLVFAEGRQQFDYHTLQGHRSPNTRSDLLYKNALDDDSHSIYTGVIVIDRGAQRSDAYQANRNLLLSSGARAATEPKLEIEADDVRCTHGATVGPIDDEQLFYLNSRGLDPDIAARLIVEGFFEEVFQKVGDRELVAPLQAKIAPHLERVGAQ